MKVINLKILTTLLMAMPAYGAPKSTKLAQKPLLQDISIKVHTIIGERISDFQIKKTANKNILVFKSNKLEPRERILTDQDLKFIRDELLKLPLNNKIASECQRSQIDIRVSGLGHVDKQSRRSCIVLSTNTSSSYQRFANIIARAAF